MANLFPKPEQTRGLTAAILLGIRHNGHLVQVPQLRVYDYPSRYLYHHPLRGAAYDRLWAFGKEIGCQKFAAIIRTAICVGLQLDGWQWGHYEPARTPYSVHEWVHILTVAGVRPRRPDLIPFQVYEETRIDPSNIQDVKNIENFDLDLVFDINDYEERAFKDAENNEEKEIA